MEAKGETRVPCTGTQPLTRVPTTPREAMVPSTIVSNGASGHPVRAADHVSGEHTRFRQLHRVKPGQNLQEHRCSGVVNAWFK